MNSVLRAVFVYLFLLFLLRIAGRRTLGELTPFDLVLLLLISEASQYALLAEDYSMTNSVIVITTLVMLEILLTFFKLRSRSAEKILEGVPTLVVERGRLFKDLLQRCQIDEADLLKAARFQCGIEKMKEIKYAILETDGDISIIPYSSHDKPDLKTKNLAE